MVNDFIGNVDNSNQQKSGENQHAKKSTVSHYNKSCKKSEKNKKCRARNSFYDDESGQLPEVSIRTGIKPSEKNRPNGKSVKPTKVKSASWKRSEKSSAPCNALANKKHKTLRKKSPNWLRLSNSKIKKSDPNQIFNGSESLSACRPGTTYSDVLFGAGSPRLYSNQSTNTAQKKLTKALFKFNGKAENYTSEDSEVEEKKHLFPALKTFKNKIFSASSRNDNSKNFEKHKVVEAKILNTSVNTSNRNIEADVVELSDLDSLSLEDNIPYGTYLEQHFQDTNGILETTNSTFNNDNKYFISSITNIPKWNFMSIETGASDGFPKFLYQFEDESYLRAEKMALLSLKLSLGNCPPHPKSY